MKTPIRNGIPAEYNDMGGGPMDDEPVQESMKLSVDISDLAFGYGDATVFDGLSARFDRGLNYVVGENGAGKTTLFRLILGQLRGRGGIEVNGSPPEQVDIGEIGYLPQRFKLPTGLTAREFVEYVIWVRGMPRAQIREAAGAALQRTHLAERGDERISRLSGGMMRRVGIAQAIAGAPRVLLLDEPSVGLDPLQRAELRRTLRQLGNEIVVIVSTHLMADVEHGDRLLVLGRCAKLFEGTTKELRAGFGELGKTLSLEDMFVALHEDANRGDIF